MTVDVQSFWQDEAATALLMRTGLFQMLSLIPTSETTPPLYYLLAWFWSQLVGTREVGLRSLSALFGTATIPGAYAAAMPISRSAGLVAAALSATSPMLVWYSQEARAYALLVSLRRRDPGPQPTAQGTLALFVLVIYGRSGRRIKLNFAWCRVRKRHVWDGLCPARPGRSGR